MDSPNDAEENVGVGLKDGAGFRVGGAENVCAGVKTGVDGKLDDDDDDDDEINKHWPALTEFYRVLFARPSICQPISDAETRLQRPTAEGKV